MMAWSTPITWTNTTLTAAQLNAQLRDNMLETAPAKATTEGSLFIGQGLNSIAERIPQQQTEFTIETTAGTAYQNLATPGPDVTVTTGTRALIGVSSIMYNNTAGQVVCTSCTVYTPVATLQVAADDNWAVMMKSELTTGIAVTGSASRFNLLSGLIPQSNRFQLKYRVTGGTGTWDERTLLVIPL